MPENKDGMDSINKVDQILGEIEAEKSSRYQEKGPLKPVWSTDETDYERIQQERRNKISGFQLQINLDEDLKKAPEVIPPSESTLPEEETGSSDLQAPVMSEESTTPVHFAVFDQEETEAENLSSPKQADRPIRKRKKKKTKLDATTKAWLKGIIYTLSVLIVSGTLAYFAITGGIDMTGLNKPDTLIDVEIPEGSTTAEIADILKEKGIIDQPLIFRLFAKLEKADSTFQPGMFTLSPDMGYSGIIEKLQVSKPRESIRVMIPEGSTIDDIAKKLEENGVCKAEEFYNTIVKNDYRADYDFIAAIPRLQDGEEYAGRIYTLEGYLFPDTYDFYVDSNPDTVIRKMLDNFGGNNRVDTSIRAAAKAKGLTVDQLITIASIVQGEAADSEDMLKVARVIYNRLENRSEFPKLECDSTRDYVNHVVQQENGLITVLQTAYDTYERKGLPVGPINNPGMEAIRAALNPASDADAMQYYFFATDYKTGITYFSKTFKEHEQICKKYKIGAYA